MNAEGQDLCKDQCTQLLWTIGFIKGEGDLKFWSEAWQDILARNNGNELVQQADMLVYLCAIQNIKSAVDQLEHSEEFRLREIMSLHARFLQLSQNRQNFVRESKRQMSSLKKSSSESSFSFTPRISKPTKQTQSKIKHVELLLEKGQEIKNRKLEQSLIKEQQVDPELKKKPTIHYTVKPKRRKSANVWEDLFKKSDNYHRSKQDKDPEQIALEKSQKELTFKPNIERLALNKSLRGHQSSMSSLKELKKSKTAKNSATKVNDECLTQRYGGHTSEEDEPIQTVIVEIVIGKDKHRVPLTPGQNLTQLADDFSREHDLAPPIRHRLLTQLESSLKHI